MALEVVTSEVAVTPPVSASVSPTAPVLAPARITRKRSLGKSKSSAVAEQRSASLPSPLPLGT